MQAAATVKCSLPKDFLLPNTSVSQQNLELGIRCRRYVKSEVSLLTNFKRLPYHFSSYVQCTLNTPDAL